MTGNNPRSVVPPPSRFPQSPFVAGSSSQPMVETTNTLSTPQGSEFELLVGEGKYVLREELTLAIPPPHPSEASAINANPLATMLSRPLAADTKLSLVSIGRRPSAAGSRGLPSRGLPSETTLSLSAGSAAPQDSPQEPAGSEGWTASNDASTSDSGGGGSDITTTAPSGTTVGGGGSTGDAALGSVSSPAASEELSLLAPPMPGTKEPTSKRRKPRTGMAKSGSTFISRVITHEQLSRRLQTRRSDGIFAFANINRSFQWLDFASATKDDYLAKILFAKGHCLCHDVNHVTKTVSHIDVIMGFSTGDIIWWEPITQKYSRINKNGIINPNAVLDIKWIPGSDNLFVAAHKDGRLVVYDKERDDAILDSDDEMGEGRNTGETLHDYNKRIHVVKSTQSRNQKTNPVAVWKISKQPVNAMAFGPDNRHLALACENGSMRIVDYLKEELVHIFDAYFGAVYCVCWSPDGRYVVTGGGDDLVAIWSVGVGAGAGVQQAAALIARFQGHKSWVRAVAFDPWRCDGRSYRFGSVGDDRRLCLWDFGAGMVVHRPPLIESVAALAVASNPGAAISDEASSSTATTATLVKEAQWHRTSPRNKVPMQPPLLNKIVDDGPLSWLGFTEQSIMVSSEAGHIRTWDRPPVPAKHGTA